VSPVRHFSPREACQTLPLVRRIVEDILAAGRRLRDLSRLHGHELSDNAAGKQALSDLQELLAELESLGCSYKDWNFQIGLVDFPAVIDGQTCAFTTAMMLAMLAAAKFRLNYCL
jgi:hypothetical protein